MPSASIFAEMMREVISSPNDTSRSEVRGDISCSTNTPLQISSMVFICCFTMLSVALWVVMGSMWRTYSRKRFSISAIICLYSSLCTVANRPAISSMSVMPPMAETTKAMDRFSADCLTMLSTASTL